MTEFSWPRDRRITVRDLQAATDRGERWAMLTSYDALTAGVFERAGVRALLVGDTAAMVVYGHDSTVPVTMDQLIPLVQAVVRGTRTALIVADLPLGAYQGSAERALDSATRYLKEGGAQAVKLEGGQAVLPAVRAMTQAGIPVMGHLGLTPQSVHVLGGTRRVQGRGSAGTGCWRVRWRCRTRARSRWSWRPFPPAWGPGYRRRCPSPPSGSGQARDAAPRSWSGKTSRD